MKPLSKPELLAPAGNREAFEAAIAAGADAVYLGAGAFNARRNADNFTNEELAVVCDEAHLRDRKVYLTANTLVLPGEMDEALHTVATAAEAGVDAAIVQDIGLMSVLRRELPELELHTSTQMNIRDEVGLRIARELGASRVTLARELSIERIAELAELGMPLECFVHGALCICQSGQCLLSSMIGGRSANRGLCAQPCRLPYTMVNEAGDALADPGEYLLSPRDLQAIDLLPRLIDAGVASLKIEGRMKSFESVSTVTAAYRSALDRAWEDAKAFRATVEEKADLSEAFSRGFTTAYLTGERGNDMMGYRRPNNRGVSIGRVETMRNGMVLLSPTLPLETGDLLEIWTARGRVTHEVTAADDAREGRVELFIRGAVAPGDRVFRVRSSALSRRARERTEQGLRIPVRFSVRMRTGEPLSVTVTDEHDRSATVEGPVVEAARTKAVTKEEVIEHIGRLGATSYEAADWDLELDDGVGIGFSTLHKVRMRALEAYEEVLRADAAREEMPSPAAPANQPYETKIQGRKKTRAFAGILKMEETGAWSIEAPGGSLTDFDIAFELGEFAPGKQIGPKLYATNDEALRVWASLGASFAWLSPELTLAQVRSLAAKSPLPLGLVVSGRQELMVSDHCFLMAQGPCDERCATCRRRIVQTYLLDRKGYRFPVTTDLKGRGHLYNAVSFDVVHAVRELREAGVTGFAIDATLLDEETAATEIARLETALSGGKVEKRADTTTGHLFRRAR